MVATTKSGGDGGSIAFEEVADSREGFVVGDTRDGWDGLEGFQEGFHRRDGGRHVGRAWEKREGGEWCKSWGLVGGWRVVQVLGLGDQAQYLDRRI